MTKLLGLRIDFLIVLIFLAVFIGLIIWLKRKG